MIETPPPSRPLSEPTGSFTPPPASDIVIPERPLHLPMIAALVVGLVVVAIPLYLLRRPSPPSVATADTVASTAAPALAAEPPAVPSGGVPATPVSPVIGAANAPAGTTAPVAAARPGGVTVGEARIVSCHDKGSKKTPPAECDHLQPIEQAVARAIEKVGSCVPDGATGTIGYQVDVSFNRKRKPVQVSTQRALSTLRGKKSIGACVAAVRHELESISLDGVTHGHARYKIAFPATYAKSTP